MSGWVRAAAVAVVGPAAVVILVALAVLLRQGPAASAPAGTGGSADTRRVVLVSGRTDHGDVELARVPVRAAPRRDASVTGAVADGTLVDVVRTEGTWALVQVPGGTRERGWVDDFRLRGVLHLVGRAPACTVRAGGVVWPVATRVVVESVRGGEAVVHPASEPGRRLTVDPRDLRELPPTPEEPCRGAAPAHPGGAGHDG